MTKGRFVPSSAVCDVDGRAVRFALCVQLSQSLTTTAEVSATLPFVIPSEPGFPATLHWTQRRVRFSVGENRMKSVNANKINRKSGEAEGSAVLFPHPRSFWKCFSTSLARPDGLLLRCNGLLQGLFRKGLQYRIDERSQPKGHIPAERDCLTLHIHPASALFHAPIRVHCP